jgi:hypothetical protein
LECRANARSNPTEGIHFSRSSRWRLGSLRRWWTDPEKRGWTSVSFVIDKKGIIRYVHPGGEFHETREADHARCDRDYRDVEQMIERLLKE